MTSGTPATQSLSLSLRMARAYRFAEQRRWREAESELAPGGGLPPETLALHAQAALVTQSGDYARALYLWKQLLQREPMHDEATRMVEAIALWQSRPHWYRYLPIAAGLAAALILVPALVWAFSPATPSAALRPAPLASSAAASPFSSTGSLSSDTQPAAVSPRPIAGSPSASRTVTSPSAASRPAATRPAATPEDDSGPKLVFPAAAKPKSGKR